MLPNHHHEDLFYQLALSFVPQVGPKRGRALIAQFGTAKRIFEANAKELGRADGLGPVATSAFKDPLPFRLAEKELKFCEEKNIRIIFFNTAGYPRRFMNCEDAPLLLYYKGAADLNADKIVAIIGTRKNTDYGMRCTEDLVEGLSQIPDIIIVSGLAMGIDTIAHKASLRCNLPTVGVVGHSLDRIYPYTNEDLAREMQVQGGILSEFPSGTKPDRQNFPMRNRLVAGMSDVTVLVESEVKGGGMITAYVAHSYGRDVAAFPGRVFDSRSGGPNLLIKRQVAALINGPEDLTELMGWNGVKERRSVQQQLFLDLLPEEQIIVDLLRDKDGVHTDDLLSSTGFSNTQLASILLQLEMKDLVRVLPGKSYRLN